MKIWKLLGIAGVAGVAATASVVAARRQRSWEETEPDDLRARLHERLNAADNGASAASGEPPGS